jgi:hypothetical protein
MGNGGGKYDYGKGGAYKTLGEMTAASFERDLKGMETLGIPTSAGLARISQQVIDEGRSQEEIDAIQQEYYVWGNPYVTAEERSLANTFDPNKDGLKKFWDSIEPGLVKLGNTFGGIINNVAGGDVIPKIGDGLKFGEIPPPPPPDREQTILEKLNLKVMYQQAQEYVKQNPGTVGLGAGGVLVAIYALRAARGP